MQNNFQKFKNPNLSDGLILYYHPYNFYSQKVLLVLYEKKIEFKSFVLDLSNGEQYSSWFLALNPKGDVPVLQDDCFVIPNSTQIINYLEDKYKGDQCTRLKHRNVNSEEFKKISFYEDILSRLPIGAISLGSFVHDDLKLNPKAPFIGPIRTAFLQHNDRINELLKSSVNETALNSISMIKKIDLHDRRRQIVYNREEFQKLLDAVQSVLIYIEHELAKNESQQWLVSEEFTISDISLGLLLYRLYTLGFESYFWANERLPLIEKYFNKFKTRDSFKKFVPTSLSILKDIWLKAPSNYKIGAGMLGMAVFAASAFAHKGG